MRARIGDEQPGRRQPDERERDEGGSAERRVPADLGDWELREQYPGRAGMRGRRHVPGSVAMHRRTASVMALETWMPHTRQLPESKECWTMTSRARAVRSTSGSLGLAFLMLIAGPPSMARAQHGAQIEKSCVNAARRACLQGTTPGCPGVNAGVTCQSAAGCPPRTVCLGGPNAGGGPNGTEACASDRDCDSPPGVPNGICTATICVGGPNGGLRCTTADQCPGGECTSCVPIPIANLGDPVACTITVTSVDPVDRIRLDTVTDEISSRSPIVPTANLLPGFGFCRFSPAPGVTGRMCIMNDDCTGSSCSTGSTCMGGIQAGLPCPTRADCPNGTCFDCLGGGVCQVSPHCALAPTQLCMSQDDCAATTSGACAVVLGPAGDAGNVPLHPHCSATASVFCMTDIECRPPMCPTCGPSETCVSADLTVLASDTNPLTDLARMSGSDEGTLQPVTLTFPGSVCIPPRTCKQTFPTCDGPCPTGETCVVVGGTCVCQTPCENSAAPTCDGTCPTGQVCASTPTGCVCETPCETTAAPTCNGTCPDNQVCAPTGDGGSCACQAGCRITGGGAIAGGGVDPTVMAETTVLTEFAGQVGAPCGCFGCFDNFDPKRASVQGEWKYKLKKHGGSLHASIFNSLVCSCLGGSVGSLCPSAEHPRTPADHICVTGIADLSPDTGNGNKASTPVAFRFEATDNGEPGTGDVYEIHILGPARGQTTTDLAKAICCTRPFVQPPGTTVFANDLGTIIRGNIQIHPALAKSTDGTCPPPSGMCVSIP